MRIIACTSAVCSSDFPGLCPCVCLLCSLPTTVAAAGVCCACVHAAAPSTGSAGTSAPQCMQTLPPHALSSPPPPHYSPHLPQETRVEEVSFEDQGSPPEITCFRASNARTALGTFPNNTVFLQTLPLFLLV